jgi:hypothetical protein
LAVSSKNTSEDFTVTDTRAGCLSPSQDFTSRELATNGIPA